MSPYVSYQESVEWMRLQPELAKTVTLAYLDRDNLAAARRFAQSEEFAQIAQWLRLSKTGAKPLQILDVGCGNGIAAFAMGGLGHHVTALDPDQSDDVGLEAARRLIPIVESAGGKLECVEGFAEQIPFSDASFDVVYARQALHHFGDLEAGLRECARVLKSGGVFIATREHVVDDEAQLQAFLAAHPLHHKHGGENAHPLQRYVGAIEGAGLQSVRVVAPWDSVVNHFPESNADVRRIIAQGINKRVKIPVGAFLLRIPGFERLMRAKMNGWNSYPGRLFSFIATK